VDPGKNYLDLDPSVYTNRPDPDNALQKICPNFHLHEIFAQICKNLVNEVKYPDLNPLSSDPPTSGSGSGQIGMGPLLC
jgi:hypothetical protein